MKKHLVKWFAILALLGNMHAYAADHSQKANVLMYIQPLEYNNPISLWHPYQSYWFYQGPVVETLAMTKLSQVYGHVSVCEGNQSGKTLVWLQPRMFYNPQVQLFYSKVTANVYTGVGKLIGTYEGESKIHGFLNIKSEDWIAKAYALAIDHMVAKMQADNALQALIDSADSASNADAPCSMVTLLPTPKIRAMSF